MPSEREQKEDPILKLLSEDQPAPSRQSEEACCSKATVLLADDLVFNMISIEHIFADQYGLRCDKVSDGQSMLTMYMESMQKTCCDYRYRIILADINMPRMDGIEASERIFAQQTLLR